MTRSGVEWQHAPSSNERFNEVQRVRVVTLEASRAPIWIALATIVVVFTAIGVWAYYSARTPTTSNPSAPILGQTSTPGATGTATTPSTNTTQTPATSGGLVPPVK